MFKKVILTASFIACMNTFATANPIDITGADKQVPSAGTFKIRRNPGMYLTEVSISKAVRTNVGYEVNFTLGEENTLRCTVQNHSTLFEQLRNIAFPTLNFSPSFLKLLNRDIKGESRSSKALRKRILNASVSDLLDETSKEALYTFILEQHNEPYSREKVTMGQLKQRLPEALALKYFMLPPQYVLSSIMDPVKTEEHLIDLLVKREYITGDGHTYVYGTSGKLIQKIEAKKSY